MHGERGGSNGPRLVMNGLHLAGVLVGTGILASAPVTARDVVLLAFMWIYFLRLLASSFSFLQRKVGWDEAFQVGPFLLVIQVVMAWLGGRADAPLGPLDLMAVVLYALGSLINTGAELQRKRWKARPENAGRLYTGGVFRYTMHPNYQGDVLLFSGFALLTRSPWAWLVPALMAAMFVFLHIPTLDRYLRQRYGDDFVEWERRTSKLVPFVY